MSRVIAMPFLMFAVSLPLLAQGRAGKYGVGVTYSSSASFIGSAQSFLISIRPNNTLILEPEIGLLRSASTYSTTGSTTNQKSSDTRLGVGLLFRSAERDKLEPYVGPRVGIIRTSRENETTGSPKETTTQSSWYFSAAAGAHYFFSRHFTVGGEVQFTKVGAGDQKRTPPDPAASNFKESILGTAGVWVLRWYF